ncbi:helix-hairpin-helix domain-containing protein [Enterococcus columbae]|uniref:Helix-hairpin-helix DNA-binding motif class 1 domain-containing protein n=1 Tax=Enterococcus columbae DSM 7374 = ATCC 51263 TaxID=1121865 RepID=S0KUC6_9ENTE|nr:helix-hairpin-helix domain-containing protein [Enterococcus columbae]EOT44610.1 hypothetical protein OMW_00666 [Enterococcus columbae DSM 7374 = ATCC 51263]EOW87494.1 hypothetical protein I568_00538 [Enterococcus columbae DSM 7374 = ATCC 51263]OJG25150.1 hypothetical protein RR47_GL001938 [Enterococcus columbae DSM 7374 = ATCC 51263]
MNKLKQQPFVKLYLLGFSLLLLLFIGGGIWFYHADRLKQNDINHVLAQKVPKTAQTSEKKVEQTTKKTTNSSMIYVDISGAINHPGVYQLADDARLFDLIEKAGGLTKEAARDKINQAIKLQDQQKVYIVHIGEQTPEATTASQDERTNLVTSTSSTSEQQQNLVNINEADLTTLQTLSGIGEKKAQAIIAYRQENGSFKSIDDLNKVPGFGEKTVEKIRNLIRI